MAYVFFNFKSGPPHDIVASLPADTYPTFAEWLCLSVISMPEYKAVLNNVVDTWHIPPPMPVEGFPFIRIPASLKS